MIKMLKQWLAGPQANAQTYKLNDAELREVIRAANVLGVANAEALQTASVLRCVDLLSGSMAMLPLLMKSKDTFEEVHDHPAAIVLEEPNSYQTTYEWVEQMESIRVTDGNAFTVIYRGVRGRPIRLQPLESGEMIFRQKPDRTMEYSYKRLDGELVTIAPENVIHLRDISKNGHEGLARTKLAQRAIAITKAAEQAQQSLFDNGLMVGGSFEVPGQLSDQAYDRLRKQMKERYAGVKNAGEFIIAEEGTKANRFSMTAQEAQTTEARNHQIEDVARAFGVPRPLLMMDDTSWGSGVEQLAMQFVRFTLAKNMKRWERNLGRRLLTPSERLRYRFDFDERSLLRGTMKDQAEFFSKALGAGGSSASMKQNEVRRDLGLPPAANGDALHGPSWQRGNENEPA